MPRSSSAAARQLAQPSNRDVHLLFDERTLLIEELALLRLWGRTCGGSAARCDHVEVVDALLQLRAVARGGGIAKHGKEHRVAKVALVAVALAALELLDCRLGEALHDPITARSAVTVR